MKDKELEDFAVLIFIVSKSKKSFLSKKSRRFLESEIFIKEQIFAGFVANLREVSHHLSKEFIITDI